MDLEKESIYCLQMQYVLTQKGSPVLLPQRCLLPWLIKPVAPSFSCFWSLIGSGKCLSVFFFDFWTFWLLFLWLRSILYIVPKYKIWKWVEIKVLWSLIQKCTPCVNWNFQWLQKCVTRCITYFASFQLSIFDLKNLVPPLCINMFLVCIKIVSPVCYLSSYTSFQVMISYYHNFSAFACCKLDRSELVDPADIPPVKLVWILCYVSNLKFWIPSLSIHLSWCWLMAKKGLYQMIKENSPYLMLCCCEVLLVFILKFGTSFFSRFRIFLAGGWGVVWWKWKNSISLPYPKLDKPCNPPVYSFTYKHAGS